MKIRAPVPLARMDGKGKMNQEILNRGRPDDPCIYWMGGDRLALPKIENIWIIQVTGADWNRDFSPWPAPRAFRQGEDFVGGADDYLNQLCENIPKWERTENLRPGWRGIGGYSLAGLFSLYAITKTDLFSRCACLSGSLWFPGWMQYLQTAVFPCPPEWLYFSLGDRESQTRNPMLSCIRERTEECAAFFRGLGIPCCLVWHPGGHFQEVEQRILAGIQGIIHKK